MRAPLEALCELGIRVAAQHPWDPKRPDPVIRARWDAIDAGLAGLGIT